MAPQTATLAVDKEAAMLDEFQTARSALLALDPGLPREEWVKVAMAAKSAGLEEEDFVAWSSTAQNFKSEQDCITVWRSIRANGSVTDKTLYKMARDNGWTGKTAEHDWSDRGVSNSHAPIEVVPRLDVDGVWASAEIADEEHPYIRRKLGLIAGVRIYRGPLKIFRTPIDGYLLVPALNADGELQSWQAIPPEAGGKKLNATGASMSGGRFIVGRELHADSTVYLCEGIGAAWSAHQASGLSAACCFGSGNVKRVAEDLRLRYPKMRIVVIADRGKEEEAKEVARLVGGAYVCMPIENTPNTDINDVHASKGLAVVSELLNAERRPTQRYRVMTVSDLAVRPLLNWRIQNVLPAEGVGAVFGPAGSGKSFLVLHMLVAVSEGHQWFDCETESAPVTYLALEGEAGIPQRVQAILKRHNQSDMRLQFIAQPFSLISSQDVKELAEAIRNSGGAGGVVAIDTLHRASPGADENDSRHMGSIIAGAKKLQELLGGFVLLVHHSGKDQSRGPRGHSSLLGALDVVIEVGRTNDRRHWKIIKSKDGEEIRAHPFRLDIVELDVNAQGLTASSCVVVPDMAVGHVERNANVPYSGNHQRVVWQLLTELFDRPDAVGRVDAPTDKACIRFEAAMEHCHGHLNCEPDRQRERFRTAVQGLIRRGSLIQKDVWLCRN